MSDAPFAPLDPAGRLRSARYRFPGGWSRTTLVDLGDGRHLAYSPGAPLADAAVELLGADAGIALLAPSAGHLLGLDVWRARFPRAQVYAAPPAAKRVAKKTAVDAVQPPEALAPPTGVVIAPVPGCRFGEVWVGVDGGEGEGEPARYWLTCDSIMNIPRFPDSRIATVLMKLWGLRTGLEVSRLFQYTGVKDKAAYRAWVDARVAERPRVVLVPCHGDIDDGPDLGRRIVEMTGRRF